MKNVRDSGGVDLQMLATNHVYDGLSASFHRTMEVYEENQIAYTGVRVTAEDKPYYLADVNGIQVGFLDYVYETKGSGVDINGIPVSSDDVELIQPRLTMMRWMIFMREADERIRDMKKGARFIVVNLHWGRVSAEVGQQREIAQKLCDLGVDALIGGLALSAADRCLSRAQMEKSGCSYLFRWKCTFSNQRTYLMDEMPTGHTEDGVMVTLSCIRTPMARWIFPGSICCRPGYTGSRIMDRSILPLDDVDTLPEDRDHRSWRPAGGFL